MSNIDNADEEKKIMDSLVDFVESTKSKKKKGIVSLLLVLLVTAIAGAYFYFKAWKQGKEYAKLLHEKDVAEQQRQVHEADIKLSTLESEKQENIQIVAEKESQIKDLDSKLERLQLEHAEVTNKISKLTSWDDVDDFLGNK
jgi:uncharacterized protein HemX